MERTPFFWLTLALAGVDWVAAWRGWRQVRWVSKTGALLALIAWFTQAGGWQGWQAWFGAGLLFSLLGDVLLMLPAGFFLGGVAAFLVTHVLYIIGFNQTVLHLRWEAAFPMIVVGVAFTTLQGRIRGGLRQQGEQALLLPVMIYAITLSLMWLMALTTLLRPDWARLPAVLVSVGAGLFFFSDSLLAYNRFVRPIQNGDLLVMITYHIGQVLITGGVLSTL